MSDINLRIQGKAGRITLQRPEALNAMTYDMCLAIENALIDWKNDPNVKVKFSTSYICLAYASTLFVQGISIYEKLRAFEYRKINIIEKNLSSAIHKLRVKSDLEFISKNLTNNTISEEQRDFLKNVQTRYNKEKN